MGVKQRKPMRVK